MLTVTLHTEGVDRNFPVVAAHLKAEVTLHTEGVDRNRENIFRSFA